MFRYECAEPRQERAVESFGLAVRLWMVRRRQRMIDPQVRAHEFEDLGGELGSVIRDDMRRGTVSEYPVVQKFLGDIHGGYRPHGNGPGKFRESIRHDEDETMP